MKVDDTGVYCCTSVGVTKYSLEDGTLVWDTPLRDSARHAVQVSHTLHRGGGGCGSGRTLQGGALVWDAPLSAVQVGQGVPYRAGLWCGTPLSVLYR